MGLRRPNGSPCCEGVHQDQEGQVNLNSLTPFLFRLNGSLAGSSSSEGASGESVLLSPNRGSGFGARWASRQSPVARRQAPVLPPAAVRFPPNNSAGGAQRPLGIGSADPDTDPGDRPWMQTPSPSKTECAGWGWWVATGSLGRASAGEELLQKLLSFHRHAASGLRCTGRTTPRPRNGSKPNRLSWESVGPRALAVRPHHGCSLKRRKPVSTVL
jgi:hypothetical protein